MKKIAILTAATVLSYAAVPAKAADTLFSDQQVVNLDFTKGLIATWNGSRGKGKFYYTYRKATNTFGPLDVVEHKKNRLSVRGTHTTCTLKRNGSVRCADGSAGRWKLAN